MIGRIFSPLRPERLASALERRPRNDNAWAARPRRAAAFLVLVERETTHLLLVKKKVTPGYHWSGQIGMVGGFLEDSDDDDLGAALREFEEELQIPGGDVRLVGDLGYFPAQLTEVGLHIFVAHWDGEKTPVPDPREIDHLVEVDTAALYERHVAARFAGREPEEIGVQELTYPTGSGDIWGVTGRTVHAFNEAVRLALQEE